MKKAILNQIKLVASRLPQMFEPTSKTKFKRGAALIDFDKVTKDATGQPIDPEKTYMYPLSSVTRVNHTRRLKKLYKEIGQRAFIEYAQKVARDYKRLEKRLNH